MTIMAELVDGPLDGGIQAIKSNLDGTPPVEISLFEVSPNPKPSRMFYELD